MRSNELVVRFLTSIGRPQEAEFYLSLFRAEARERFAIIVVADSIMQEAADALMVDLRFLAQLELTPVVMFGLVAPDSASHYAELTRRQLSPHVQCSVLDVEDADAVCRAVQNGAVALLPANATIDSADHRFDALSRLARRLATRKIIFLGKRSGLQSLEGDVPSLVNVTTEYDGLMTGNVLPETQQALLRQARRLLESVSHPMTIAVTSPFDLLRELFTLSGAGTLIRQGSSIERFASYKDANTQKLRGLIESSFGRPLLTGFFDRPIRRLVVADDYRGAAVVTDTEIGAYLTKFAVDQHARGEGVGRDLWEVLSQEFSTLFWRSRLDNPITPWYQQHCDGLIRDAHWHIFWRGLTLHDIPRAIELARKAPLDFAR